MTRTSASSAINDKSSTLLNQHGLGLVFLFIVITAIGSGLYATISWMWDDQRLPLSKIVLQGDLTHVSAKDVQDAFAHLDHIGTFMSQDINVLQSSVENIEWVSQASVRKQWPDTVKVFLTEYQASAIWNGIEMLDASGVVFNGDVSRIEEEKVKLYGPTGTELKVLNAYRESNKKLATLGLTISSLVLNERRAWQVILSNGIRVELGKDALNDRLQRFIFLYQRLGDKVSEVSYIDLRYDTGAAVGWFPVDESTENGGKEAKQNVAS
ncbi:cell division protein FtsQ [Vibrio sp. 10N.286.49.C2]|uniref:cell division protein FtsQ/DivIB n=1 Tax=unclassified Vibrio TaxID=2614977 RepID=UPI000CAF7A69|nr:cell division protein FtsQ [Vibrio sp. 10N.286.49.C2]PMH56040.1 cell division protein FtsQ [Vibrio sp. 10N.286.49.B1]PMH83682.1 cell division protein FtsQ [Vibrio sp. 10N.286.48.B7]